METFKLFLVSSISKEPRQLQYAIASTCKSGLRDETAEGRSKWSEFECQVPLPLPSFLVIFALGEWPKGHTSQLLYAEVYLGPDLEPFHIGTLSKENRSIVWQGTWREDLLVRGVLMSDEGRSGLLVVSPALLSKSIPETNQPHVNHASRVLTTSTLQLADQSYTMETSQTESQLTDSMSQLDSPGNSPCLNTETRATKACLSYTCEDTPTRSASRLRAKEMGTAEMTNRLTSRYTRKRKKSVREQATPKAKSRSNKPFNVSSECQNLTGSSSPTLLNWTDMKSKNNAVPSARWGHTLCAISKKQAVLVGGQGEQQVLSKDCVWLLNIDNKSWCVPSFTQTDSTKPQYRMGHTAVYDPMVQCVYIYGGSKNLRWFSDVHVLDIESWRWSLVKASGRAPTRAYHTSTLYCNDMYVFGGVFPNPDPKPDGCSNHLKVFSPATESWYEPLVVGARPRPRSGHSATLLGHTVVIFGGWDAPECFNDLHCLDLTLMEFTSMEVSGIPPSPRSWHGSAALPGSRVVVHGGFDGDKAMIDSFIYRLDTNCWSRIVLPIPSNPSAGHTILAISSHDNLLTDDSTDDKENEVEECKEQKMLMFGGGNNEGAFFNKVVTFKLQLA